MDSHDNVPRSDELQGMRDIKLKSDLTPHGEQTALVRTVIMATAECRRA